jgi:hypothetical protein
MCNTRDLFSVTFDRLCGRKVYCGTRLQLQRGYLSKIKHILGVKLPIGRYIGGVKCIFPKKNESLNLLSRVIMFLLLLLLLLLLFFFFNVKNLCFCKNIISHGMHGSILQMLWRPNM